MIAQKIIYVRREKKISEKQLAEGIDMSITGLRQAMAHNDLKISVVKKIASYLSVSLKYLIDDAIGITQTETVDTTAQFSIPNVDLSNFLLYKELDKIKTKLKIEIKLEIKK